MVILPNEMFSSFAWALEELMVAAAPYTVEDGADVLIVRLIAYFVDHL